MLIFKCFGIARQVDENDVHENMAADFLQPVIRHVHILVGVLVRAANTRRVPQRAGQIVTPGMIRTLDDALTIAGFIDQNRAPVTAHIVKDADRLLCVADNYQRLPVERGREGVTDGWDVLGKADAGPVFREHAFLFNGKKTV